MGIGSLSLLKLDILNEMIKDGNVIKVSLASYEEGIIEIVCESGTGKEHTNICYEYGKTLECVLALINFKYKVGNDYWLTPESSKEKNSENNSILLSNIKAGKKLSISRTGNEEVGLYLDDSCISKSDSVINVIINAEQALSTNQNTVTNPFEPFCLYGINEAISSKNEVYITRGKNGFVAKIGEWERLNSCNKLKYKIKAIGRGLTVMEALIAADCDYRIDHSTGYYPLKNAEGEVLDAIDDPISAVIGDGDVLRIITTRDQIMHAYLYNSASEDCYHISKAENVWNLLYDMHNWLIHNPVTVGIKKLRNKKQHS